MARLLDVAYLWVWALAVLASVAPARGTSQDRPNIVIILVDDQETLMNTIDFMPTVQEQLIKKGTSFQKHYCTGEAGALSWPSCRFFFFTETRLTLQ